jgi:transposase InsO family protein
LEDKLYLSVIMDLYNNEIIAYSISDRNNWELVEESLEMARDKKEDVNGTILHSDRGSQYTSYDNHDYLADWQVKPSMSKAGDCFDNACVESFFSHLKTESLYLHPKGSWRETQKIIEDYIVYYNTKRLQLKLEKLTPEEFRSQPAA